MNKKNICTIDRQLISIYLDGELPSPWKEKMEVHLAECSECAEHLERYRRLSQCLHTTSAEESVVLRTVQDRVWQNVNRRVPKPVPLWRHRVLVPLPALAAAAAVLIVFSVVFVAQQMKEEASVQEQVNMALGGMPLNAESVIPVSDRNTMFQYLEGEDTADTVIIKLPENQNFSSYGEPTYIKAVDYSRRIKP
ncbi:MAG: zf-HC2 domain-containing protein [Spirochaetaceae bacterium]|jgi:anti-sigma factor RsiW|nr:zf-HC2 domain-containing protein [Spirochaetaceae bacterium]